jgi:hypothetical protein
MDWLSKYTPDQPRDSHGRFTTAGAALGEQSSHMLRASGDLATRLGSAAYDLGTLIYSARALRSAPTRAKLAAHLGVILADVVALHTQISALPAELRTWSSEAHKTLQRTRVALLKLKRRLFAERQRGRVNKMAADITAMMATGAFA